MPTPGRLGRLPNDPSKPRLRLASHLGATIPPNPAVVDWLSRVPNWPMLLNDQVGDCVFAAFGHMLLALSTYGQGNTATITDADILTAYEQATGYRPSDPATDQGAVIQDALGYWRKTGIAGHKILAFAQVNHLNPAEVDAAINLFGTLIVGVNLPQSAMTQFEHGQPWVSVNPDGGTLGGHAIHVGYFNTPAKGTRATTWGAVQDIGNAWWVRYVDEAWVAVAPEWLDASGHSPAGLDLHGLGEDFAVLTGQPNPFPTPTPGPPPPIPPAPPVDADHAFAAALRGWLGHRHIGMNHQLALRAQDWLKAKGL